MSKKDSDSDEYSDDEDYDSDETPEELKEKVKEWTILDNRLSEKQKEAREIRKERKELEERIIELLEQLGETSIEISDGKLIKNKSETKSPISSNIYRQALESENVDKQKIDLIIKKAESLRPKTQRKYIKRTRIRKRFKKINTSAKKVAKKK